MVPFKRILRNKTFLALIVLAIVLAALLAFSDETVSSHFNYKIF